MTYSEFVFTVGCILAIIMLAIFMGVWEFTHPVNPDAFIIK